MHKQRFSLIIYIFLSFSFSVFSQFRTFSPYSRYGLGELNNAGFGQNTSLGNSGIAMRSSDHLNNMNPASYSGLDTLSFFLEAGLKGYGQKLESSVASQHFSDINFDYFAIGFPISGRAYTSIGLVPYSNTGYNIEYIEESENLGQQMSTAIGKGNISKVYLGLSIEPVKNLSLGTHISYLFGNLKNLNLIEDSGDNLEDKYGKFSELHVNDMVFDFGLQYRYKLDQDHSFIFGAVFTPKTALHGDRTVLIANNLTYIDKSNLGLQGDTISYTDNKLISNALELPMSLGFGLTYEIKNKLIWTADYKFDKWSKANMSFFDASDSWKISSGVEFIPKDRDSKRYINRVRYRAGTYYTKDYISTNQNNIMDFGMSFGIGLPLKRTQSSMNFGVQFGERGTTTNNNLKEKYTRFTLNITLHEYWFVKQKFD